VRTRVGTGCYYSPNKTRIARTTYYSSENNKHINEGKILKRKEYKIWKWKKIKYKVNIARATSNDTNNILRGMNF
jgi:hypothetical protein